MSDAVPNDKPHIRLEDLARATLALAGERNLGAAVTRFLEELRGWAAPSAVLAAARDPAAESGWRLLPALTAGSGPLGAERTLPQLVQEAPECLERPTLVRPREEVPGVRPRDNCVVPWWHEGESGILVLRGVPRPCPPNLPEAVALLSSPLWPRLLGGPAERVEAGLAQIERLAERLREDAARHIERLRAAQPAPAPPPIADDARVAALEEQLEAARLEVQGASAARDDLRAQLAEIEKAREDLAISSRANDTALTVARRDLTEARQEAQRATLELEDFRERVTALETTLRATESERDRLSTKVEALSARSGPDVAPADVEALEKARAEAEERARALAERQEEAEARARAAEERRHEAEQRRQASDEALFKVREDLGAARRDVERLTVEAGGAGERVASLEASRRAAEAERDRLRAEVERLSSAAGSKSAEDEGAAGSFDEERRALEQRERQAEERLGEAERLRQAAEDAATRARQELAEARQGAQGSTLEIARLTDRLSTIEPSLRAAEAERDRGRGEIERLTTRLESLRQDLATVTERLEAQRRVADATRASPEAAGEARGAGPTPPVLPPSAAAGGEAHAADGSPLSAARAVSALRGALSVLRRTPFVPPSLRIAMQEAEALVGGGEEAVKPWLRIVLLDRDAASVEPLAAELEEAGLDVRIANYPEELALLMKTPDARDLHAVVCDVLAFRADQNVAGLFRSWQKDRPSLALYLAFGSDSPTETERAKRVPLSLTAGRFRRPLIRQEVVDMLTPLAKRAETT